MAIPGLPAGTVGTAADALAAPVRALEQVVTALRSLGEVALAVLPVFSTVGEKFKELGERFKTGFRDNIGIPITDGLKAIGRAIKYALSTDALDYVTNAARKVNEALKSIGGAAVSVAAGVAASVGALSVVGLAIGQAVQKANPAVYEQFTYVLNDLIAVVGQALIPVFRIVTSLLRAFADTLTTFGSGMGEAIGTVLRPLAEILKVVFEVFGRIMQALGAALQAVAPALAGIGQAFLEIVKAVQPVLDLLVDLLGGALGAALGALASIVEAVAPVIMVLARVFGDLFRWVVGIVREVLAFIGVDLPDTPGTRPGSSVGAAVRQVQITDVSSVIQQAQMKAFSLGSASADPASRTASAAEELKRKADLIYEALKSLPRDIANAIAGGAKSAIDTSADFLGGGIRAVGGEVSRALGLDPVRPEDFATGARALGLGSTLDSIRGMFDGGGTVKPGP